MLEKRIKLKENDLVNLLTSLYTDAQMALDGTWDPTYDKNGFNDQQFLIEQFCKANKTNIMQKVIGVTSIICLFYLP